MSSANGWRGCRVVGLAAVSESQRHADLAEDVVSELIELVRATVENRDPKFAQIRPATMMPAS